MDTSSFPIKYARPVLPILDVDKVRRGEMSPAQMREFTEEFARLGAVCLRDSRVTDDTQVAFRRTMVGIHGARPGELEAMDGADTGYQFGMTPPGTEIALDHSEWVASLPPEHRPLTVPGVADSKARFMWAIGPRPKDTVWPNVNSGAKIPKRFRSIAPPLNNWGGLMLDAAFELSRVVAVGCDLPEDTFLKMLHMGPHILGPTGSRFQGLKLGQVLTGLHYDFNFFTIHGQTDIRALICWTRDGEPFLVEVPDGCLLAQAGKSLEYMTGGFFHAGKHEVVVTPESLEDAERHADLNPGRIRVSSNLFVHLATRWVMRPMGRFATADAMRRYRPIYAGDYEVRELVGINLFPPERLPETERIPPQYRPKMARLRAAA